MRFFLRTGSAHRVANVLASAPLMVLSLPSTGSGLTIEDPVGPTNEL